MNGHGISSLVDLLVQIQKEKLLDSVPITIQKVKEKLTEYKEILEKFPKGCKNRKEFNRYLRKYCDDYDIRIKDTLINVKSFLSKEPSNKKISFHTLIELTISLSLNKKLFNVR